MARVASTLGRYCRRTQGCLLEGRREYGGSTTVGDNSRCSVQVDVGGRSIKFCSGKYAKLADGAVVAQLGNTNVMVTAVSDEKAKESTSWTPLRVDYRERASAAGRIPYNFFRRELRSMDREILTSRLIDRSIRPLFPEGYACETQIICNLLSVDGHHDHEVLSINGACAALLLSDIPWNGPIAAVRVVADPDGNFLVNPTKKQEKNSDVNVIVVCAANKIIMVEGYGSEVHEEKFCNAVKFGMFQAQDLLQKLSDLTMFRRRNVRDIKLSVPSSELTKTISDYCSERIMKIFMDSSHKKLSRDKELFLLRDEVEAHIQNGRAQGFLVNHAFWNTAKECMKSLVLDHKIRCDGRGIHDLRPIECEVDLFELLHGSARFCRGETQVMSSVTLDSPEHAAKADEISLLLGAEKSRNFMVHYDFPPFANNRTGHFMFAGRREIGHGVLAEKALKPLLPIEFPFTIRIASQVTDSNGSSSMATVCGSSLALFDAGVPMSKHAAGVACGLILDSKSGSDDIHRYQILSDINGIEDALGCMDFKLAGTRDGITSCQVDVKNCSGLSFDVFQEAVMLSRESRLKVLDIMDECQSAPRPSLKENGPAYEIITVPASKRSKLVGMGGHKIRALIEETGARVKTIEDEKMSVFAPSRLIMDEMKERIDQMLNDLPPEERELEVGAVYDASINEIRPYGFMVKLVPSGVKVLLHASQLDHHFVDPFKEGYKVGDEIKVKYLGRDENTGRLEISRKVLLDKQPEGPASDKIDLEVGNVYDSNITDIRPYGFMVKLLPSGVKVLLHSSQIQHKLVNPYKTGYKVGDEIKVKYLGMDENTGKIRVSHKALIDQEIKGSSAIRHGLVLGEVYKSRVVEVRYYGLMVELLPSGSKLLLHSSHIDHQPVDLLNTDYKVGDEIMVKYIGKDRTTGKALISRKALLDPTEEPGEEPSAERAGLVKDSICIAQILDVQPFGLIVQLVPSGAKALLHASQIAKRFVNPLRSGYKPGEEISVKFLGQNKLNGLLEVSRKALLDTDEPRRRVSMAKPTGKRTSVLPKTQKTAQSGEEEVCEAPIKKEDGGGITSATVPTESDGSSTNKGIKSNKSELSPEQPLYALRSLFKKFTSSVLATPTESGKSEEHSGSDNRSNNSRQ